jgi:hypothetical protein
MDDDVAEDTATFGGEMRIGCRRSRCAAKIGAWSVWRWRTGVVRKNSVRQQQTRESTRDAGHRGSIWRGPHTLHRDDGVQEPFVGYRLRAADREHLDPVTCADGRRCSAVPLASADGTQIAESTNPNIRAANGLRTRETTARRVPGTAGAAHSPFVLS